jgi:drug/metabolite transporter (DMT)-like permease
MSGPWLIFAAAVLWSAGGLGIKSVDASPLAVSGWRSAFALPILLAFCARSLGSIRPTLPLGLTVAAYASTLLTLVAATKAGTAAAAILLQYTAPVWLVPLGYLLPHGDRPARRELLVAACCMVGVGLFFIDLAGPATSGQAAAAAMPAVAPVEPAAATAPAPAGGGVLLGILLGLASGVSFALLTGGLRWSVARGRADLGVPAVLGGNALIALVCLPSMTAAAPDLSAQAWLILAGLGTFQIGAAYVLYAYAVRTVPAMRATLIAMAEPILNPILVAAVNGEVPGAGTLAGGAVLLTTLAADALVPRSLPDERTGDPACPPEPA